MDELILVKDIRYYDQRGFFAELYNRRSLADLGINLDFVQDNHSVSLARGTIRGLHYQSPPYGQSKLVRCGKGAIFDVAVDIRRGSPTYGHWKGFELTTDNCLQLFIPVGFAHGFITLEPNSEVVYKCSNYYAPGAEGSVLWSDPGIGIVWPLDGEPIVSDKDAIAPMLSEFVSPFIYGVNS